MSQFQRGRFFLLITQPQIGIQLYMENNYIDELSRFNDILKHSNDTLKEEIPVDQHA